MSESKSNTNLSTSMNVIHLLLDTKRGKIHTENQIESNMDHTLTMKKNIKKDETITITAIFTV